MRVLIIDDDAAIRRLLRMIVEGEGHEVTLAGDGADGWRTLTGPLPPDVLILDRMLPDMDGADLLRRLREEERTRDLPVLLLTAAAHRSARLDDGGPTRVVAKPFDLAEFRALLAELAAG
ncbi:response regulator [Actinomadura scrupuli]|uniref:response regulator n=1 Tax=Actinomadura scrupuli TaxID=559629 RepID=UPI003D98CBD5